MMVPSITRADEAVIFVWFKDTLIYTAGFTTIASAERALEDVRDYVAHHYQCSPGLLECFVHKLTKLMI
jgi:hypothetical protein